MKTVGALLGTMSGSMGGMTASRNRGGQYFRQRVIPTNPNTTRQQAMRSAMAAGNTVWIENLSAANRASWANYAANTPRTGPLGNEVILTGQQAYVGAYSIRTQIGQAVPATGPSTFDRGQPVTGITDDATSTANVIDIDTGLLANTIALGAAAPDDGDLAIYLGPPINPTINYYDGPYQLADVVSFAASATTVAWVTDPANLTDDTALAAGQVRAIKIVAVYDDGRTSSPFQAICTVTNSTP